MAFGLSQQLYLNGLSYSGMTAEYKGIVGTPSAS